MSSKKPSEPYDVWRRRRTMRDRAGHLRRYSLNGSHPLARGLRAWYGEDVEGQSVIGYGVPAQKQATVLVVCEGCSDPADAPPVGVVHRETNWQINWDHYQPDFRAAAAYQDKNGKWHSVSYGKLKKNVRYTLVLRLNSDTIAAYRAGIKLGEVTGGPVSEEAWPAVVGSHVEDDERHFNGFVRRIYIWDRALSDGEIYSMSRWPEQILYAHNIDPVDWDPGHCDGQTIDDDQPDIGDNPPEPPKPPRPEPAEEAPGAYIATPVIGR